MAVEQTEHTQKTMCTLEVVGTEALCVNGQWDSIQKSMLHSDLCMRVESKHQPLE